MSSTRLGDSMCVVDDDDDDDDVVRLCLCWKRESGSGSGARRGDRGNRAETTRR